MAMIIKLLVVVKGYKVACAVNALVVQIMSKEMLMDRPKHLKRLMQLLGKIQKMASITRHKEVHGNNTCILRIVTN